VVSPYGNIVIFAPCIEGFDDVELGNTVDARIKRHKDIFISGIQVKACPVEYAPFVERYLNKLGKYLKKQYDNVKANYEGIAKRQGLNPQNVIIDYGSGGNTNTDLSPQITPQDNSIFNSIIKPVTSTVPPPSVYTPKQTVAPSFNLFSFWK
jgi:hypothetical protein